jgi:uncharacterized protein (TIGR02594 family)
MTLRQIGAVVVCAFALSISAAEATQRQKKPRIASQALIYCASDQTYRHSCPGTVEPTQRRARRAGKVRNHSAAPASIFSGDLVSSARRYLGQNARQIGLHRYTLWCSAFMRFIAGTPAGVDDRAISWAKALPRTGPHVGAIVVVRSRRNHVGVVSGFDANGNPIIISGNHNNRVAESVYPKGSVIAYVRL